MKRVRECTEKEFNKLQKVYNRMYSDNLFLECEKVKLKYNNGVLYSSDIRDTEEVFLTGVLGINIY